MSMNTEMTLKVENARLRAKLEIAKKNDAELRKLLLETQKERADLRKRLDSLLKE